MRLVQGERNIGHVRAVRRNVLHNHVDIDLRLVNQAKHARRRTGHIRYANNGNLGLPAVVGDTRNQGLFQGDLLQMGGGELRRVLRDNNSSFKLRERRTYMQFQVKPSRILHTAQVQNLRPVSSHLQHFFASDGV